MQEIVHKISIPRSYIRTKNRKDEEKQKINNILNNLKIMMKAHDYGEDRIKIAQDHLSGVLNDMIDDGEKINPISIIADTYIQMSIDRTNRGEFVINYDDIRWV